MEMRELREALRLFEVLRDLLITTRRSDEVSFILHGRDGSGWVYAEQHPSDGSHYGEEICSWNRWDQIYVSISSALTKVSEQ